MPAPPEPLILAVDLGTSGVKVALISLHGRVLGWETQPVGLQLTPDGGAEQSPREWWQAFVSTSRRLLARDSGAAQRVRAG
jgi:xylulokinase